MASPIGRFRGHRARAILDVALLLGCVFLFAYSILSTQWVGTPILAGVIIVFVTIDLVRMTEKSNEDFAQFIANVSHHDFASTTSLRGSDRSTQRFIEAQRSLLEKYRKLKADRTAQHEYLQLVVEHVDTALLCLNANGLVEFINKSAKDLLGTPYIASLARIESLCRPLARAIVELRAGESRVLNTMIDRQSRQLMVVMTEFRLLGLDHKLVSIQNIKSALDAQEIESWQKLIKVMNHEIMNSMTPIVSLSNHLKTLIREGESVGMTDGDRASVGNLGTGSLVAVNAGSEQFQDLVRGIDSIASRSQGLLNFVDAYRSLSKLPRPEFRRFAVTDLFDRLQTLLEERIEAAGIVLDINAKPRTLSLEADIDLIEQVLLNLLSNAIDAIGGEPAGRIELHAFRLESGRTILQVRDNGPGIPDDIFDNIFTPFFTTKETGTGVGLSLSRQLAKLNNATLSASTTPGRGSVFQLQFRAQA